MQNAKWKTKSAAILHFAVYNPQFSIRPLRACYGILNSLPVIRTVSTGQDALRTTFSAVLPNNM
jgi:hypothetical protein